MYTVIPTSIQIPPHGIHPTTITQSVNFPSHIIAPFMHQGKQKKNVEENKN